MRDVEQEISKEQYDKYQAMSRARFFAEIEQQISAEWRLGYGHYWARLAKRDGIYFIVHTIGSHCD